MHRKVLRNDDDFVKFRVMHNTLHCGFCEIFMIVNV